MRPRSELNDIFCSILGNNHVYFQPPESIKLQYPCIIYEFSRPKIVYGSNKKYQQHKCYSVTLIDKNPDSIYYDKLMELDYCECTNMSTVDNLNHYYFDIYF